MAGEATEIIGVDFSGAEKEGKTWICEGNFDGATFTICKCSSITRSKLLTKLQRIGEPSVAAFDFPFSVPQAFAREWVDSPNSMKELWSAASNIKGKQALKKFKEKSCEGFVDKHGEPIRLTDKCYPESFSPLHTVNPDMVPMTVRGMKMLHGLVGKQWGVLPIDNTNNHNQILFEVMPGLSLIALKEWKELSFRHRGYKNDRGKKKGKDPMPLREKIFNMLSDKRIVDIDSLEPWRKKCLNIRDGDCLDSVLAAITASLWARDPNLFRQPPKQGEPGYDRVQLEGWLYVPAPEKLKEKGL